MSHDVVGESDFMALLRGELDRIDLEQLTDHLRSCESCRVELVDAAQVHGSLTAAGRLLRLPAPRSASPSVAAPTIDLRDGPPGQLPSLRPVARRRRSSRSRGGFSRGGLTLVAACAIAATSAAVVLWPRGTAPTRPIAAPAARSVALTPLPVEPAGFAGASGKVTMAATPPTATPTSAGTRTAMDIAVTLRPPVSGSFYYAWLFDPKSKKMLPLGVVSADNHVRVTIPADLIKRYTVVDISLEKDDGNAVHSATSVLRGTY
jgi:anti-sigma factor RsiW